MSSSPPFYDGSLSGENPSIQMEEQPSLHDTKKDKPLINKLRIVQPYEANFNSYLKNIIGRRLMEHSERHGLNEHQLYGSRKGRTTYNALITTRVMYYMARVQRGHIVFLFNDLK